jgi:hypothetical protein
MYRLFLMAGMSQMILGVVLVAAGALLFVVNRVVGEHENHVTRNAQRLCLVGWWLVVIGAAVMIVVVVGTVPVRRA